MKVFAVLLMVVRRCAARAGSIRLIRWLPAGFVPALQAPLLAFTMRAAAAARKPIPGDTVQAVADRSRIEFAPDVRRQGIWTPRGDFWVIADTHFWHDSLCRPDYESRPADHTARIARAWRDLVAPDDWIVHLGDVGFASKDKLAGLICGLPGRKLLVWGNHDRFSAAAARGIGFEIACRGLEIRLPDSRRILLSHRPDRSREYVRYPGHFNVHGHVHSQTVPGPGLINCSVEARGYRPWRLSELLAGS